MTIPIIVGIAVVVSTAIVITYVYRKKNKQKKTLVDPTAKVPLKLTEKETLSHDTQKFRFALPSDEHTLGLPIGQHIFISATIDGETVIRAYTPVSSDEDLGHMDLVVKVYRKDVHPKFPLGGKMSQYLDSLSVGDSIEVRGPSGRLKYLGHGKFSMKTLRKDPAEEVFIRKVSMIAGGTGITPMLQLIRHITSDPSDSTELSLLFANQTEKDILLRNELEKLAKEHPSQFKLWYTVDVKAENWKYSVGFVNAEMIQDHLFPPGPNSLVLMCGPPPMVNFACNHSLDELGYDKKMRFAY